ncbi:MAG TPA: two-component system response regulator [Chloroflexi bacterium]|nr:two-component system response regulator [Chloroflexota bacterium]HHW85820.1 response regulator [Chloroflexota bacterium]
MPGKVLIVDDEANIVISLEFLMEQAGYTVAVARTGEEAIEKIDSFHPDLVLLDVMLPGINGFDILQRIRQHFAPHEIAVVMLTAKGREVEVTKGLALGANAYITKPFSTRDLLAEVRRYLEPGEEHETLTN